MDMLKMLGMMVGFIALIASLLAVLTLPIPLVLWVVKVLFF
jgi:hypothetical protein